MTRKLELVERFPGLLLGKVLRAQDGHRIGRVIKLEDHSLEIEQGLFRHDRFHLDYDEITSASGDSIYVAIESDQPKMENL